MHDHFVSLCVLHDVVTVVEAEGSSGGWRAVTEEVQVAAWSHRDWGRI